MQSNREGRQRPGRSGYRSCMVFAPKSIPLGTTSRARRDFEAKSDSLALEASELESYIADSTCLAVNSERVTTDSGG